MKAIQEVFCQRWRAKDIIAEPQIPTAEREYCTEKCTKLKSSVRVYIQAPSQTDATQNSGHCPHPFRHFKRLYFSLIAKLKLQFIKEKSA